MTNPLDFYHTHGMQRTSQNLKEDVVKNDFGVSAQPLISIGAEHIIAIHPTQAQVAKN
jgi:hypothetical protein